jgi:serine/threonine protein kinase
MAKLKVGDIVGTFRITEFLGRGAHGRRYRVSHVTTKGNFFLHLLPSNRMTDKDHIENLVGVFHSQIVPIVGTVKLSDRISILTTPFTGITLKTSIEESRFPPEDALITFKNVLLGAAGLHAIGLTHQGIRPANILVSGSRHEPVIKLLNHHIDMLLRHSEYLATTNDHFYTAPEVAIKSSEIGPASDIFSLGCVLYEMITGVPAFAGNTTTVGSNKALGKYQPIVNFVDDCPSEIITAIDRALSPKPAKRYSSIQGFAKALFSEPLAITPATLEVVSLEPLPDKKPKEKPKKEPKITRVNELPDMTLSIAGSIFAGVLLIVLATGTFAGKRSIDYAQGLAVESTPVVHTAIADTYEHISELINAGANPKVLRVRSRAYETASEANKMATGLALNLTATNLAKELDPQGPLYARFLGNAIDAIPYCRAVWVWHVESTSIAGALVETFGLGAPPTSGLPAVCRATVMSTKQ